jgi:hypothetical protein
VTKHFVGQAKRSKPIWVISCGQIAPGRLDFLLRRVGGDAENDARVVCVETAPLVGSISVGWLDPVVRVNSGDLCFQQEGMATVVGLDLNEGLVVIERVTKSMVRRDEDCAHLALAQARFQGDAKSLKGVCWRCAKPMRVPASAFNRSAAPSPPWLANR